MTCTITVFRSERRGTRIVEKAYVAPIYKKNKPSDPSNHRPVSRLSTIGKVMEKIIYKHVLISSETMMF